jgi:hypothetical protein
MISWIEAARQTQRVWERSRESMIASYQRRMGAIYQNLRDRPKWLGAGESNWLALHEEVDLLSDGHKAIELAVAGYRVGEDERSLVQLSEEFAAAYEDTGDLLNRFRIAAMRAIENSYRVVIKRAGARLRMTESQAERLGAAHLRALRINNLAYDAATAIVRVMAPSDLVAELKMANVSAVNAKSVFFRARFARAQIEQLISENWDDEDGSA